MIRLEHVSRRYPAQHKPRAIAFVRWMIFSPGRGRRMGRRHGTVRFGKIYSGEPDWVSGSA